MFEGLNNNDNVSPALLKFLNKLPCLLASVCFLSRWGFVRVYFLESVSQKLPPEVVKPFGHFY